MGDWQDVRAAGGRLCSPCMNLQGALLTVRRRAAATTALNFLHHVCESSIQALRLLRLAIAAPASCTCCYEFCQGAALRLLRLASAAPASCACCYKLCQGAAHVLACAFPAGAAPAVALPPAMHCFACVHMCCIQTACCSRLCFLHAQNVFERRELGNPLDQPHRTI